MFEIGEGRSWKDLTKEFNRFKFEMTQISETSLGVWGE